jgi:hypothetical protein
MYGIEGDFSIPALSTQRRRMPVILFSRAAGECELRNGLKRLVYERLRMHRLQQEEFVRSREPLTETYCRSGYFAVRPFDFAGADVSRPGTARHLYSRLSAFVYALSQ